MPAKNPQFIDVLDASQLSFSQKLCAAALQGLINRGAPGLFLDYGIYDDPAARKTNETFLNDELWFGKYRDLLGNQDQHNLAYYQQVHGFQPQPAASLDDLVRKHKQMLKGCVIWDAGLPDTANIALMLAAQENLLPVEANDQNWAKDLDLAVQHDLRGKWDNRIALYQWAFDNLFEGSKSGFVACLEPGWMRPEFADYLVQ